MATTVQLYLLISTFQQAFGIQGPLSLSSIPSRQKPQIHNELWSQVHHKLWPQNKLYLQNNNQLLADVYMSSSATNEKRKMDSNSYTSGNFTGQASWLEEFFTNNVTGKHSSNAGRTLELPDKSFSDSHPSDFPKHQILRNSFDEISNVFHYVNRISDCKAAKLQNLEEIITEAFRLYFKEDKTLKQILDLPFTGSKVQDSSALKHTEMSECPLNLSLRSPNHSELNNILRCMNPGLVHHLSQNVLHLKLLIRNFSNQLNKNNSTLSDYLCIKLSADVNIHSKTCSQHLEQVLRIIDTGVISPEEYKNTQRRVTRSTRKNDYGIKYKKPSEPLYTEVNEYVATNTYEKPATVIEVPIESEDDEKHHKVILKLLGALTLGAYGILSVLFVRQFLLEIPIQTGPPGVPGNKGASGDKGMKGSKGMKGFKGEAGDKGLKGDEGDIGAKGMSGDKGLKGAKGEPGKAGIPGPKGEIGDPGPPGDEGLKGLRGDPGPAGLPGRKGETGSPGEEGPASEKGEKGQPGMPGMKGEQGDQGKAGENGFKGIKGETGMKGDKGMQADAGPQGPAGSPGSMGEKGMTGDTGMKGDKGMQGYKGVRGDDSSAVMTEGNGDKETALSPCLRVETANDKDCNGNVDLKRKKRRDVGDVSDAPLLLTLLYESKVLPYSLENTLRMNSTSTWDLEPFSNEGIEENLKVLLENHEYKNNIHVTSDGDPFRRNGSYNIDDAHSYKNNQDKQLHSKLRATHPNRGHKKQLNKPNQASQNHIDDREISAGIRDTPQLLSLLYRRKTEEDTKSRKVMSRKCAALDSINELWTEYQDPAGCVKCSLFDFFKSSDGDLESYIMAGMAFVLGVQDSYQVQDAVREARVNNREIECKRNKTTCFIVSDEVHHESARRFKKRR